MIKIIVEGPVACGKSYFIKHYLQPAIRRAAQEHFHLSMEGFNIVERRPDTEHGDN